MKESCSIKIENRMENVSNDFFYSRLPVNEIPLADLLDEAHLFYRPPGNWWVVITDVKGSSRAIQEGRHETVNLIATGCIVALLNIAFRRGITVPYFFGGDGATFLVPPSIHEELLHSLLVHQKNSAKNYNIDLRVGSVAVQDVYDAGHSLSLTKLRASNLFVIPVVLGEGLSFAERLIKKEDYRLGLEPAENHELDLSGMQCRWDKVKPPENTQEVVSLIVTAPSPEKQSEAFRKVIRLVDQIYGEPSIRKPITVMRLRIRATLSKLLLEMRTRFGKPNLLHLLRARITTLLGPLYFKTKVGREYLVRLVDMSDTLVLDGKINTVISGSASQREELTSYLDQLEAEGQIQYGLCVSPESVISCYVKNLNENHVHFVDGAGGGYTRAATELKKKFALAKN
jgi:hypothetical protein